MMHGHEKSRSAIVAVKPTNKAERSAAEQSETKGRLSPTPSRTTSHTNMSTRPPSPSGN